LNQVGYKLSAVVCGEEYGRALLISDRVSSVHYIARLKDSRVRSLESATNRRRICRKSSDEAELHASTLLKPTPTVSFRPRIEFAPALRARVAFAKPCVGYGSERQKRSSRLTLSLGGIIMAVQWEKDINSGLKQAQESGRAVLLDFSAAPM
jgi:hypothetical protein